MFVSSRGNGYALSAPVLRLLYNMKKILLLSLTAAFAFCTTGCIRNEAEPAPMTHATTTTTSESHHVIAEPATSSTTTIVR